MGSFFNAPICLASLLTRKKLYLHEANSILGKSHKIFQPYAQKIFSFLLPNHSNKVMPLRKIFFQKYNQAQIQKKYNLKKNKFTILIFTGSQGAKNINHIIATQLIHLKNSNQYQIIHILGKKQKDTDIENIYQRKNISHLVINYCESIAELYSMSQLCICRAGASTIAELLYLQKKAILIPYPYANENHQEKNFQELEKLAPKHYKKIPEKDLANKLIPDIEKLKQSCAQYPSLNIDFLGKTLFDLKS